jgi:hypothetical protein
LVTVADNVCFTPTATLPKFRLAGFDVIGPACAPAPERLIVSTEFDAFDVIVTLPLEAPGAEGWNDALKLALCPAASVMGALSPLMLNPDPATAACEIVMLDPPVLVRVSDRVCLVPTGTVPKLRLAGFGPRTPATTPVPINPIFNTGFEASDAMETVPLATPVVVGANEIVKVVLCDGVRVRGAASPLIWNPLPPIAACATFTLVAPLLVKVTVWDCWPPTFTLPKFPLVPLNANWPPPVPVPVTVRLVTAFVASVETLTVALNVPIAFGVNVRLSATVSPAATVAGRLGDVRVKYFVVMATLLMVIG